MSRNLVRRVRELWNTPGEYEKGRKPVEVFYISWFSDFMTASLLSHSIFEESIFQAVLATKIEKGSDPISDMS